MGCFFILIDLLTNPLKSVERCQNGCGVSGNYTYTLAGSHWKYNKSAENHLEKSTEDQLERTLITEDGKWGLHTDQQERQKWERAGQFTQRATEVLQ